MVSHAAAPSPEAAASLISALLARSYSADLARMASAIQVARARGGLPPDDLRSLDDLVALLGTASSAAASAAPETIDTPAAIQRASRWIVRERRAAIASMVCTLLAIAALVGYLVTSHRVSERLAAVEAELVDLRLTSDTIIRIIAEEP